jgi:hypothetical protein
VADHEGNGLSFGFANGWAGVLPAFAFVNQFVSLCSAQHKLTYVVKAVMW